MPVRKSALFEKTIFINCPFDDLYKEFFRAIVFTVIDCGFNPRCALEASDSGQVRIDKIFNIIEESKFGIHDISRTDLDTLNKLPRFNMPLELGIFLGSKRFGNKDQKTKNCMIFDSEKFRSQKFISDVAGQDISSHDNQSDKLIKKLRDWISNHTSGSVLPGGEAITKRFELFCSFIPSICDKLKLDENSLTFGDLVYVIRAWQTQ